MVSEQDRVTETDQPAESSVPDQGPGWMPAILAATALMGILGFIFCAFSTWVLFQYRTEFAARTVRGAFLPEVEQSLLDPATKSAVLEQVEQLAADLEGGKYENSQAAGILLRLQRTPVLQWGELQAVEAFLKQQADAEVSDAEVSDGARQFSRLQRAVELGRVTSFDFEDVLQPVRESDSSSPSGSRLIQPLTIDRVEQVVHRARLLADRENIPDEDFEVRIESIVRREIERGATEGG